MTRRLASHVITVTAALLLALAMSLAMALAMPCLRRRRSLSRASTTT
jgi:hypothetical protein